MITIKLIYNFSNILLLIKELFRPLSMVYLDGVRPLISPEKTDYSFCYLWRLIAIHHEKKIPKDIINYIANCCVVFLPAIYGLSERERF